MSGPRVWVDENDLRLVLRAADGLEETATDLCTPAMREARDRLLIQLDPLPPPPLRPYRANMQGHGA